ncbi:MAG TPA: hypothetical protein VGF99_08345 [Myxococcota bacterium]
MTRTAFTLVSLLLVTACVDVDVDDEPPPPTPDTTQGVLPTSPHPSLVNPEDRACAVDSDCVLVDSGSCVCKETGAKMAIAVDAVDGVAGRLEPLCAEIACFLLPSSDPTSCGEAACVDGVCEVWGYDDRAEFLQCESIHAPRERTDEHRPARVAPGDVVRCRRPCRRRPLRGRRRRRHRRRSRHLSTARARARRM